jgi:hypothetical protein
MHAGCCWKNLKKRDNIGDLGVDGRVILKWILKEWDGLDWIRLAQDTGIFVYTDVI